MADQEPADKPGESDADGDLVAAAAAPSDEVDGKTLSATNGPASGDATTGSSSIKGKAVVQKVQAKRASQNSSEGEDDSANEEKYAKERQDKLATGKDFYCWNCHKEKANVSCTHCPRSYHFKCLTSSLTKGQTKDWEKAPADWTCLECRAIAKADEAMLVSPTLSKVSEDDFCTLLKFALQTIKQTAHVSFHLPVVEADFPEYKDFIVHPMDFLTIDRNVRKKLYSSTDAFLADIKWIIHNSYIFNDHNHTLTQNARYFWKVAKNEMGEIEVCPDCFMNFYVYPKTWFVELCDRPHALLWARLKGHPFWPAKVVRIDAKKKEADCRFFGAHDRAWVPFDSCFQLSEQYAWAKTKSHKSKLEASLNEMREHIAKVEAKHPGAFKYAEQKEPFDPSKIHLTDQETPRPSKPAPVKVTKPEETEDEDDQPLVIAAPAIKAPAKRKVSAAKSSPAITKSNDLLNHKPNVQQKSESQPLVDASSDEGSSTSKRRRVIPEPKAPTLKEALKATDAAKRTGPRIKFGTGSKLPANLKQSTSNGKATPVVEKPTPVVPNSSATDLEVKKLKDEVLSLKKNIRDLEVGRAAAVEKAASELKKKHAADKEKALSQLVDHHRKEMEAVKKKQWCAACFKEAIYFCCWNTSYCGLECQHRHWGQHMAVCQQQNKTQGAAQSSGATTPATSSHASSAVSAPAANASSLASGGGHSSTQFMNSGETPESL